MGGGLCAAVDASAGPERLELTAVPTREQILGFLDDAPPAGRSPYVDGAGPSPVVEVVDADPRWADDFAAVAAMVAGALGPRAIRIEHVGSTSVAGLPAKPVIDVDLIVADTEREDGYVPALEQAGFTLAVREPWWYGHRLLRWHGTLDGRSVRVNLHVFDSDSPEPIKHLVLRTWLRSDDADRRRYAQTKRAASAAAAAAGEHVMQYNARKERVIREIYQRAFAAAGLLEP